MIVRGRPIDKTVVFAQSPLRRGCSDSHWAHRRQASSAIAPKQQAVRNRTSRWQNSLPLDI